MAISSGPIHPPGPGVGVCGGAEGVGEGVGGGVGECEGDDEGVGVWDDAGVDAVGPTDDVADGGALNPGDGSEV